MSRIFTPPTLLPGGTLGDPGTEPWFHHRIAVKAVILCHVLHFMSILWIGLTVLK